MQTREDRRYEQYKAEVTQSLTSVEQLVDQSLAAVKEMRSRASDVAEKLLVPVEENPLLDSYGAIRRQLWPFIPTSNLLEVCVRADFPGLVEPLRTSLQKLTGENVVLLGTQLRTDVPSLPRSALRLDQLVLSQQLIISLGPHPQASALPSAPQPAEEPPAPESGIKVTVHLPLFVRRPTGASKKSSIAPLTTPVLEAEDPEDAWLVTPELEARIVGKVFSDEISAELPLELPKEFSDLGLTAYTARLHEDVLRLYYANRRGTPAVVDAPVPSVPTQLILKLTRQLLYEMVQPKLVTELANDSIQLQSLTLVLDVGSQVIQAVVVGCQREKKSAFGVEFWGEGCARVRQTLVIEPSANGGLALRTKGEPVLIGQPWVDGAGAQVPGPFGIGSVGVPLPDPAVDFLADVARRLGLKLPVKLKNVNFAKTVDLAPLFLASVRVREADVLLDVRA